MTEIMGNELLQGERVYLDAITKDDLPDYVKWFADMEFQRFLNPGIVFPFSAEDEEDWYEIQRKERQQGKSYSFAIRLKDGATHVGGCGLMRINWQARSAMAGINIGARENWGKGYGTDAMRVLLRYAFMELNMNRVGLEVFSYNPRAIRSYEKCGFREEGRVREAIFRDGVYFDKILMGILRREWEEAR